MKKYLFVSTFLIIFVSCGPRLIYPHLNWLIPWYVSDYVSLDGSQKNMLQKRLAKQLDWHCRTQMPAYAETFRAIGQDFSKADQPINHSKIQFHYNKLMELWKGLMKQIGPDITDILITTSNEQIDELFENLSVQNQEFKEEYVDLSIQQLNGKRQKRALRRLKPWIPNLTDEQKNVVSAWSSQMVPISEDWLLNRELMQINARRLLDQRNNGPAFRAALLDLILNPDQIRTSGYQAKIKANIEITIKYIIHLERLLSPQQRNHLINRIESLAADFEKLSCDPKDVPGVQGSRFNVQG